jgi:hypothetical protein
MLDEGSFKQYNDEKHWHNQFREQIIMRIDESIFKVLFNETMGAPNSPIRVLVGMMILKESFVWSDSQLFEHCRFNLLTRSALGLFNINDPLPAESTYYLMRQRIYEHQKQSGEDLMDKTFKQITREQVKEFDVNGRSIRMDSKLIGSNIAYFTRYEIIHQSLCKFYKTMDNQDKFRLSLTDRAQLEELAKEESHKTVYRSTKEEIKARLQLIGILIYTLLKTFAEQKSEQYQLLQRVFNEQYKVIEDQQVELRTKEEIHSDSVQSPHDSDCAYRNKRHHQVKGYSINITETCSEDNLNLITNVKVDKANVPDTAFVQDAITATAELTDQKVEKVYLDGAYHSQTNEDFCNEHDIDFVLTGIQGELPRYDLDLTPNGLIVTDTKTGESIQAVLAKKFKSINPNSWRIRTEKGNYYFTELAVNSSILRKKLKNRTEEELHKRNNVEATIFQLGYPLHNNKSKYRGMCQQQIWAYCRCLWVNLVRIINFIKQICQRTSKAMEIPFQLAVFCEIFLFRINFQQNWVRQFSIVVFLSIIVNYSSLC